MGIEDNELLFRKYAQLLATPERPDEVVSDSFVGHDLPPGLTLGSKA